nr:MAG TPA: hypothetical protein [Caudoviricetes sp.]
MTCLCFHTVRTASTGIRKTAAATTTRREPPQASAALSSPVLRLTECLQHVISKVDERC